MTSKDGEKLRKNIHLRFIGSCRFMKPSFDKLASGVDADQSKNPIEFYTGDEIFKFMRCKGVYPYEYTNSWEKF